MTLPTNRDSDKFVLRFPDGMRDRIKASAEAENRSMNAEIVKALESWLSDRDRFEEERRVRAGQPESWQDGEPTVNFINNADDVEAAIDRLTKRYSDDLRLSMLELLQTVKK